MAWHNGQTRDLDVFVHFDCADATTTEPRGTEAYYITQEALAGEITAAIALASGLINRGAKYNDNLYVLNHTTAPAILIEVCFVDSSADVAIYQKTFSNICTAIATAIAGVRTVQRLPRPPVNVPPERPSPSAMVCRCTCRKDLNSCLASTAIASCSNEIHSLSRLLRAIVPSNLRQAVIVRGFLMPRWRRAPAVRLVGEVQGQFCAWCAVSSGRRSVSRLPPPPISAT